VLNSCIWLNLVEFYSGLSTSLYEIHSRMEPEARKTNLVVLDALKDYLLGVCPPKIEFVEYLEVISEIDPFELRDFSLDAMIRIVRMYEIDDPLPESVDHGEILNDLDLYLQYGKLHTHRTWRDFDRESYTKAHELLQDPKALKKLTISHLTMLWEEYFAEEWERNEPELERVAAAFDEIDWQSLPADEVVRAVLGRDMISGDWITRVEQSPYIRFVPSPHIGPYASLIAHEVGASVIFGARLPKQLGQAERMMLTRSDLINKLDVLADERRMRILEMIIERGSITTQDVMKELGLGQSSASRHLIHMCVAGLLKQKRLNRTKHYRIDPAAIESIMQTFEQFIPAD